MSLSDETPEEQKITARNILENTLLVLTTIPFAVVQAVTRVDDLLGTKSWDDPLTRALLNAEHGSEEATALSVQMMDKMEWIGHVDFVYVGRDVSVSAVRFIRQADEELSYALIDPISGRLQLLTVDELIELFNQPVGDMQVTLEDLVMLVIDRTEELFLSLF